MNDKKTALGEPILVTGGAGYHNHFLKLQIEILKIKA